MTSLNGNVIHSCQAVRVTGLLLPCLWEGAFLKFIPVPVHCLQPVFTSFGNYFTAARSTNKLLGRSPTTSHPQLFNQSRGVKKVSTVCMTDSIKCNFSIIGQSRRDQTRALGSKRITSVYDLCRKFLFGVAVVHLYWMHNYLCLVPVCTDWQFPVCHLKRPPVFCSW